MVPMELHDGPGPSANSTTATAQKRQKNIQRTMIDWSTFGFGRIQMLDDRYPDRDGIILGENARDAIEIEPRA